MIGSGIEVLHGPCEWFERKHVSTGPSEQPTEEEEEPKAKTLEVVAEVPISTCSSSNLVGFNRRMVEHLNSFINSYN
ncbi:hypothetical protein J1N35_012039 [Gossypium stocksii]|uniref:Uncharacterized protein n=1 Tax=Gossypium stocksii TaxID=47602 RepID=A0A9D4AE57_9ROSI|nr:hypothetical protein J1N35_012039 [Gossypium stocksii]